MGLKDLQSKYDVAIISAFRTTAAFAGSAGTKNSCLGYFYPKVSEPEYFTNRPHPGMEAGLGVSKNTVLKSN